VLAAQRRAVILEQVRRDGAVRVAELTAALGVSDMTVRRDLEALGREGVIAKVHGGATRAAGRSSEEPGFEAKSVCELAEKHAVAKAAVALVQPGQAVALGAGTTTHVLAQHLLDIPDLTVATNSVKIADVLRQRHTVVLTGGVRTPSDALVGPVADLVLRSLHFDVTFLGCHGMDPVAGFTTPNLAESETNRAFVRACRSLVVTVDSTKYGTVGLVSFAALDEADVLVTDDGLDADAQATLAASVGRLVVAPLDPPRSQHGTGA